MSLQSDKRRPLLQPYWDFGAFGNFLTNQQSETLGRLMLSKRIMAYSLLSTTAALRSVSCDSFLESAVPRTREGRFEVVSENNSIAPCQCSFQANTNSGGELEKKAGGL